MPEDSLKQYNRGVMLHNPMKRGTSNYQRAISQVAYLQNTLGLKIDQIETRQKSSETVERMLLLMKRRDLLLILGGDGTVNTAISAIIRQDKELRPDVLVTPAGTANDFAKNHTGHLRGRDAIAQMIRSSHLIDIRPMSLGVEAPDGYSQDRIAVNNAGFNFTAGVASMINAPEHRESTLRSMPLFGQKAQEALSGYHSLKRLDTITTYEQYSTNPRRILDRTFIHAHIAGKYGRYDISHEDDEFLDITTEDPTKRVVLGGLIRSRFGHYNGKRRRHTTFLTGEEPIVGHVDGETFNVMPHSRIDVALHDQSFHAYSR